MMETAKMMKKRKDEEAMKKELGGISAELEVKGPTMETARAMKPMASSVVSGILKDIAATRKAGEQQKLTDLDKQRAKDANAVTEIDGEVVKWKAGKNPAYEEKLMKLKKKK